MSHEEQSDDSPTAALSGIILWRGRPHGLTVDPAVLILDMDAYADSMAAHLDSQAQACENDPIDGDPQTTRVFRDWARAFRQWRRDHDNAVFTSPTLTRRVSLTPLQVRRADLGDYLAQILALSQGVPPVEGNPQFLFAADETIPVLYGTRRLGMVVAHTGPDVRGVEVATAEEIYQAWSRHSPVQRSSLRSSLRKVRREVRHDGR